MHCIFVIWPGPERLKCYFAIWPGSDRLKCYFAMWLGLDRLMPLRRSRIYGAWCRCLAGRLSHAALACDIVDSHAEADLKWDQEIRENAFQEKVISKWLRKFPSMPFQARTHGWFPNWILSAKNLLMEILSMEIFPAEILPAGISPVENLLTEILPAKNFSCMTSLWNNEQWNE
mgnify:CR=1 FL=1